MSIRLNDCRYGEGVLLPVLTRSANQILVSGDATDGPSWSGVPYTFRYRFSPAQLRGPKASGGEGTIITPRGIHLRSWLVAFEDTAHFVLTTTPDHRRPSAYVYNGRNVGEHETSGVILQSGVFQAAIPCRADRAVVELSSRSHLPCRFQSAAYRYTLDPRSGL